MWTALLHVITAMIGYVRPARQHEFEPNSVEKKFLTRFFSFDLFLGLSLPFVRSHQSGEFSVEDHPLYDTNI